MNPKDEVHEKRGFWVRGSGLIFIPKDRANEIPKVIKEHHKREAQLNQLIYSRRTW